MFGHILCLLLHLVSSAVSPANFGRASKTWSDKINRRDRTWKKWNRHGICSNPHNHRNAVEEKARTHMSVVLSRTKKNQLSRTQELLYSAWFLLSSINQFFLCSGRRHSFTVVTNSKARQRKNFIKFMKLFYVFLTEHIFFLILI